MRMSSQHRTFRHRLGNLAGDGASSVPSSPRRPRLAWVLAALAAFVMQRPAAAQSPNPNYSYLPYSTAHPYAPMTPQPAPHPNPELLPGDLGWLYDFDSPVDLVIRETLRGAFMRVEYLNWDIEHPGNNLLGAPILGVDDPRDPFLVQTANNTIGVAESLSTHSVDFQSINGIRGTLGLPFRYGSLEGSIWGLEQGFHQIEDKPFLRDNNVLTPRFVAVGLLSAGQPGTRVLLFDRSFQADYRASAWGSDVNLYYAAKNPRLGLGLQPLAGFRYMNYDESLSMRGVFDNSSGAFDTFGVLADPFTSTIRSAVNNNVYSLQVGFKADFKHQFFTLGFEPKLAFGANDYSTRVSTNDLRSFDDPTLDPGPNDIDDPATNSVTGRTVFSPTVDLGFSAKVHLTNWMHLRAGYNVIWTGNLARADRAIEYNDNGNINPPAVIARQSTDSILIQGLSVGAEILLP